MKTIAIYNMKGGVGKTTTAVNLSYLAARSRLRVLLWDLDPQAASTFTFRIQPHVSGFGKRSLENSEALSAAIKETDYENLYLLPADFAYHKLDRLLSSLGNPARVLTSLLGTIGNDFDIVILDCPAGFSRLAKAVLAAADVIVAPTIPTVLSLRMAAELVRQAERIRSRAALSVVFNMVDRRKALHRQASELAAQHPEIFFRAEIPYASVVEQMAARRAPTAVYGAQTPAAAAFSQIWVELQSRLRREEDDGKERRSAAALDGIESVIARLEATERRLSVPIVSDARESSHVHADGSVVHRFDTDQRDLEQRGHALELHERQNGGFVVLARTDVIRSEARRAEAQIDRSWTVQILAGKMSPLDALERRIRSPLPRVVELVREAAHGRRLRRVETFRIQNAAAAETAPDRAIVPLSRAAG
ncbi:MAG TPA: ParA family protein [Vicinamibacterales bacterium]|jgi:cellulose biosynthesis protein BcsQ